MELAKECKKCLYEKEIKRAENIKNLLERKQYIKEVEYALEHLSFDSPPEYIDCFLKIYKNSGQEVQSYKKLKEKYNIKMQQKVKEFEEEINQSENPLKLAIQLAIVGNYIDCIAMPTIDDKVLNRLLMQYREIKLDDKIYKLFTNDLANSRKVIYCTDNCGEIVLDKLLIKYLTLYYPQLEIQVIVRGEEIGNDASIEDAENISMQEVAAFEGNGTTIAGTSLHLLSDELKKKFYKADMIISKGQGNYETLSGSGLNIYYLFLCKCNHLQKIFLAKFLDPIISMECERR